MTEAVRMLRLPAVLALRGCSKSRHYADIKAGRFPAPAKQGPKISVWPETDIINEQRAILAERDKAA